MCHHSVPSNTCIKHFPACRVGGRTRICLDNLYANKQTLHDGQQQIMIHWDELGRAGSAAGPQTSPQLMEWSILYLFISPILLLQKERNKAKLRAKLYFEEEKGIFIFPIECEHGVDRKDKEQETPFWVKILFVISSVTVLEDFLYIQMNLTSIPSFLPSKWRNLGVLEGDSPPLVLFRMRSIIIWQNNPFPLSPAGQDYNPWFQI